MQVNQSRPVIRTHEGAVARHISPVDELRRSVLSCLLWEDEFYEDGQTIAYRIQTLAKQVPRTVLMALALEARHKANLRHVPLLLLLALVARTGVLSDASTAKTISAVITRPDEMAELLALYWKDGKRPLSKQLRKGLAMAFQKFDAYALAKYNRDGKSVSLRDVMFLVHPKPKDEAQAATWKLLADEKLPAPDTWEVALSGGADKRETFERLIREGKLGYLALLRNLRNMDQAGVDPDLVNLAIVERKCADRVLPFRYVAAARAAPRFERALDTALVASITDSLQRFRGDTAILVDVSGSMNDKLSSKSDLTRMDAAATLAAIWPGPARIFTFSERVVEVPQRTGMAGVDAIRNSQAHGGTYLMQAIEAINALGVERLVVISDEQAAHSSMVKPRAPRAYMVNVASARNGIGYGNGWAHIDGFSENVIRWIAATEEAYVESNAQDRRV